VRGAALAAIIAGTINAASAADFRGFVEEGPAGLLVYRACHGATLSKQLVRVSDKTPDTALTAGLSAVRDVMNDKERPVYAEFAGDMASDRLVVRRFHRMVGHIESCASLPKDVAQSTRLLVTGSSPNWRFVLDGSGGKLELADRKPVRFPASAFVSPTRSDGKRIFDAWSPVDGGSIRVEVTETLCREDASETATGAHVVLRYGSTSLEGCTARF
jgi:hypothetical protein